jgi:hypothetical protein
VTHRNLDGHEVRFDKTNAGSRQAKFVDFFLYSCKDVIILAPEPETELLSAKAVGIAFVSLPL